jgi:HAD superfamily hydrolase (TIGR01509 family)
VAPTSTPLSALGRLALFDLDNTLFDRASAFAAWSIEFVESRHLDPSALELLIAADRDGHASRSDVFGPLCERFGLRESPREIEALYRTQYPTHFVPDPAVQDALRALRGRGWAVVIVTNGPASQIEKITKCGLDTVVDGWCISDLVGSAKPDRAIFDAAADLVGLPLKGWMVGDTSSVDVLGGRSAGLQTIWLARGRPHPLEPSLAADVTVESIGEAFAVFSGD